MIASSVDVEVCYGENYQLPDGSLVNTAGVYQFDYTAANGCDSVVSILLSVLDSIAVTQYVNVCFGEVATLEDGTVMSQDGVHTMYLTSQGGCDSV
ncbi:MAG: hypothetical protein ACKPKO_53720, partial [Candidatus Fonsibacter sp.]